MTIHPSIPPAQPAPGDDDRLADIRALLAVGEMHRLIDVMVETLAEDPTPHEAYLALYRQAPAAAAYLLGRAEQAKAEVARLDKSIVSMAQDRAMMRAGLRKRLAELQQVKVELLSLGPTVAAATRYVRLCSSGAPAPERDAALGDLAEAVAVRMSRGEL